MGDHSNLISVQTRLSNKKNQSSTTNLSNTHMKIIQQIVPRLNYLMYTLIQFSKIYIVSTLNYLKCTSIAFRK